MDTKNPFHSKIQKQNTLAGLPLWRVESFVQSCHVTTLTFVIYCCKFCAFIAIDDLVHKHTCLNHEFIETLRKSLL